MTNKLGKGLSAIFGENIDDILNGNLSETGQSVTEMKLDNITPNPFQPRKIFNIESLNELALSINEHGVFSPILVRKSNEVYEIIAGERRWRASKMAEKRTIPVIIMKDFTDKQMMEISILENIQREDLSPIEEAISFQQLIDNLGYTQEKLGKRLGKSRVYITNSLRLLKLPDAVKIMVTEKVLTVGQIRPLIALKDNELIESLANEILEHDYSARDVEKLTKKSNAHIGLKVSKVGSTPDYLKSENELTQYLDAFVQIRSNKIIIEFDDTDELIRIVSLIKK